MINDAILIMVGLFLLINGILGLMGGTMPFAGMEKYTNDSIIRMARMISIPYLVVAISFFITFFLNVRDKVCYEAYFVSIPLIIIVLIFHFLLIKKVLVEKQS